MGAVLGALSAIGEAAGAAGATAGAAGGAGAVGAAGAASGVAGAAAGAGAGAAASSIAGSTAASAMTAAKMGGGIGMLKTAGEKILGTGGAAEVGAGAVAGAAENVNPLARLSLSWDNAGRAFQDAGTRALSSTSEGRALSTLINDGDVNMDSLRSAAVQYGTDKLGEALGKHGKGGQMVAAAIGLKGQKEDEEKSAAQDGQAAVEAAANPAKHGVYGQFGAAPPVQVPRQAVPQFNAIDYYNSLMGGDNGRYQA